MSHANADLGESGLGKTTFLNTLFTTQLKRPFNNKKRHEFQQSRTVGIEINRAELEERGFTAHITVVDTPGLGDFVTNNGCWESIVEFIDDQHDLYMRQEQQPRRHERADARVHACLYFIRPTGHSLRPLDVQILKALCSRVNVIPVIAKADSLGPTDILVFKERIMAVIEAQDIKIFRPPIDENDPRSIESVQALVNAMPFSVIGSENDVQTPDGRLVKGRKYAWGVAEVENDEHCDFRKLRNLLLRTHMLDLIVATDELHYEGYRASQLMAGRPARTVRVDNAKFKEEEETLRKRFTEQVKQEEARFRSWEQRLIAERDKLNRDLEQAHMGVKELQQEVESLQLSQSTSGGSSKRR